MSNLTDKELEKLFRGHLLDLEKDPSPESWKSLSKVVAKKNFLTIGWKHFNIYQVIVLATILLSISLWLYNSNSKKITTPISKNSSKDSIKTEHNNNVQEALHNNKTQSQNKKASKKQTVTKLEELPLRLSTEAIKQKVDSSIVEEKIEPVVPVAIEKKPEEKKIREKRIITLIQRDTLIIKDTVSVRRKKKIK